MNIKETCSYKIESDLSFLFQINKIMPLSILDTHTQILGVIPASKKLLIDELCRFVKTVDPRHADKKYTYSDYLHILYHNGLSQITILDGCGTVRKCLVAGFTPYNL